MNHPIGEPIATHIRELVAELAGFLGIGKVSLNAVATLLFAARIGMDDSSLTRGDIQQAFREMRKSVWDGFQADIADIRDAETASDLTVTMMLRWLSRHRDQEEIVMNLFGEHCFEDHDRDNFRSVAIAQTLFIRTLEIRQFAQEFCDTMALKHVQESAGQD